MRPQRLMSQKVLFQAALLALAIGSGCDGCDRDDNGNGNGPGPNGEVEVVLDAVVPSSGPQSGGTEVRLEGRGFLEGVAHTTAAAAFRTAVRFGEAPADGVEVVSDMVIRAVTPPGVLGSMDVRVENPNGTATCEGCFEFVEDEGPIEPELDVRIDRVAPVRGPVAGGTRTRIEGEGFLFGFAEIGEDVRPLTAVLFGGNTAVDFDVIDDRLIEAVAPPGNAGHRDVTVQNPNGEDVCEGCFHYFVPVRAISISPDSSPVEGGVQVTLTGEGLTEGTLVTVGGRSAISPVVLDGGETATFVTPPAAGPGAVDVVVLNQNGRDTLRRRLLYFEEPRLLSVDPPVGEESGGTTVRLAGEGLAGAESVTFGGEPAGTLGSAGGDVIATTPPGEAGATVDVELVHPRGTTTLSRAFSYVDPAMRDVTLLSVTPSWGGLDGGNVVVLSGTGLEHPDPQVRFGSVDAQSVVLVDANRLEVVVPEAAGGAGTVDVQVRNERGGALLSGGYTYERTLRVDTIEPSSGPAVGGTSVTVSGAGFDDDLEVRVGALVATDVEVLDETTLTATTPPGSAGPADVAVGRGTGESRRHSVLAGGFVYHEEPAFVQLEPERGSQAGGTYVLLFGAGFTDETEVTFGAAAAQIIERTGGGRLAVRTPPGAPGLIDVTVEQGGEQIVRQSAFQYYDPTNIRGGASGGPMLGTINVTTLDAYTRAPLESTHVILGSDADTSFQGETDIRGQITFSDPSLVKPVSVTASRAGHEAVTVARVDARDLTVYLTPNEGEPMDLPPPRPVAFINPRPGTGTVCGFKLPPDRELAPNQREEAWIWATVRLATGLPPFRALAGPHRVTEDCDEFGMASRSGSVALYARYGIVTEDVDPISGQVVESFEPLIMGITRGIEVPSIDPPTCTVDRACPTGFTCSGEDQLDPSNPASFRWCLCDSDSACGEGQICNAAGACQDPITADIVLSMHLDLDVPVQLMGPPIPPDGSQRVDATYAYLELGSEGVAFMGEALHVEQDEFFMERMPRLPGDGFVFLNMSTAGGGYPLSLRYRREIGDLASGVKIGPMQPMNRIISPAGGVLTGNRVQWSYEGEPIPDVVMVVVSEPGFVPLPVWQVILPGTESSVTVPPSVMEILREYPMLEILLITALSPRFDFDYFSYRQLGLGAWDSFTQAAEYFMVP